MTPIPCNQIEAARHWAALGGHSYEPLVRAANGRITIASTNGFGSSWVTWPADVPDAPASSVPWYEVGKVRSTDALFNMRARRALFPPTFDLGYFEQLAVLPRLGEAVMRRDEVLALAAYADSRACNSHERTGVYVQEGRLIFGLRPFAAYVVHWEAEPVDFHAFYLRELFSNTFTPLLNVAIRRQDESRIMHVWGEVHSVREHHLLASMRRQR